MKGMETIPLQNEPENKEVVEQEGPVQAIVDSFMRLEEKYTAALLENEAGNEKIHRSDPAIDARGSRVVGQLDRETGEFLDFQVDPNINLPERDGSIRFEMKISNRYKGEIRPHIAKFNLDWENPLLAEQTKNHIQKAVKQILEMQRNSNH